MPDDDAPDQEPRRARAAAAAAGAHESLWARQGRAVLQGSHSLTEPLARWVPELAESEFEPSPDGAAEQDLAIPPSVLQPRPPQRLPEDAICRSPIAGLVIAVMAAPGVHVSRHQPVLVIEAMKMQNNVSPEVDGIIKTVHVAPGDAVKAGQILFELL